MHFSENSKIFAVLFILFLIFYTIQIPFYTSKPDVLVFAIRSLEKSPITSYAYLESQTMLGEVSLPNYHLGHTLLLWTFYKIMPNSLATTIWPAGFFSAICGALIIGLTYLIWIQLGINKKKSLLIAVSVGFVPSLWEHSVIGEVYVPQLLFTLLFLYAFLKDRIWLSTFSFMFANLISPLSALSFGLFILKNNNNNLFKKAFTVALTSLLIFLLIHALIGSDLFNLSNPLEINEVGRNIGFRTVVLLFFIIINFNFFLIYLSKGFIKAYREEKQLIVKLIIATLPQLFLIFAGSTFFIELGSFQLPIFWALAFPLGLYLATIDFKSYKFIVALIGLFALSYSLWIQPNNYLGSSREKAGEWLKENNFKDICIIGPWRVGINVLKGRDGFNLDILNKYYFDKPDPTTGDLLSTNKDTLIIAESKKLPLRVYLSELGIPGMHFEHYDPIDKITVGRVEKIFENETVELYIWKKRIEHHNL